MKFLSNPGNSGARLLFLLLALPLLLYCKQGISQNLPDSAFEKVTLSFVKKESGETKIKDGRRLLFLSFYGFTPNEQKKLYYKYKDSLLITVQEDSTIKSESWKKLSSHFDSSGVSKQLSFSSAIDDLITPKDTTSTQPGFTISNVLQKDVDAAYTSISILRYVTLAAIIIAAIAIIITIIKTRKVSTRLAELEEANNQLLAVEPETKSDTDKKAKKLSEELRKAKDDKKIADELKAKLQEEKDTLEKEKETLAKKTESLSKSVADLEAKHKTATVSLDKTEKEKKKQAEAITKLEDDLGKLTAIQKEQEDQTKKMAEMVAKMESVAKPASFPDINTQLHAWFLLQDFIKGYKSKEFSVLSTPNFSKWVLQQEHTYPELDITNLAGNAPIINFMIDLKKRKITKIAPDGSYLVLINQKITQPIFDSLETGE
ncbi:hypothetical protein LZZ85_16210 [Terrimonas sp. NA20]|uniref:Uncharacterized protein n=1 Tax=Terrimonas ginsenosidimutans TaxID=2908004 RepID=A0ABS9KU66_9BACT|nr:hypothetical protein [Terrimonas ginsenosidimutans]MCG2615840.1 hypothetical protein [Terrimonas ginsenosidimutans]